MTPHERRAVRIRKQSLNKAIETLKRDPRFPAAQVQIFDESGKLQKALTAEEQRWGNADRLVAVLRQLDIRATAYLDLVENID
jgi:hypothetical protein